MTDISREAVERLIERAERCDDPAMSMTLRALLDAAEARAVVKPLVFADEYGDGILTSRETGKLKRVIPQNGGGFYASSLSTEVYPTAEAAVAAYQADHVAFVLRCLHPASPLSAVAIEKALIAKRWQRNYPPYGEHFGDWLRLNDKEITCAIMDWAALAPFARKGGVYG